MSFFSAQLAASMHTAIDATFGDAITYMPAQGASLQATAIFVERAAFVDASGETPIESTAPAFDLSPGALAIKPAQGDAIVFGSRHFEVSKVDLKDGGGYLLYAYEVTP